MAVFEFNGACYTVQPFQVTLKNHEAAKEWLQGAKEIAVKEGTESQLLNLTRAVNNWPELLAFVQKDGGLNPVAVERNEGAIRRRIIKHWEESNTPDEERIMANDEDIRAEAEEAVQQEIQRCVLANPELARTLYFAQVEYPETATALLYGIDLIKATADRTKLDDETKALIDSALSSDFWQTRTAQEIASYVNFFRERFK